MHITAAVARAATVALPLLLVACGSDSGAGAGTTVPATTVPVPTPAPATTSPATTAPATTAPATTSPETTMPATSSPADGARTVVEFVGRASIDGWSNVDDSVMGGVSASTTTWEADAMVFSGDLSLENNGGFTSVRSPVDTGLGSLIGTASSLQVAVIGDGRSYVLQLRTVDGGQYIQQFTTVADQESTAEMPLADFTPVGRFLQPVADAAPLDPAAVAQVTIYLLEKQPGPFRLALLRITAA